MKISRPKLFRKILILGFSLIVVVIGISILNETAKRVIGVALTDLPNKFCDDPNNEVQSAICGSTWINKDTLAAGPAPYQTVSGNVDISGNVKVVAPTNANSFLTVINDNVNTALVNNVGATLFYNRVGVSDTNLAYRFHTTTGNTGVLDILNNGNINVQGQVKWKGVDGKYVMFRQFVNGGTNYIDVYDSESNALWGINVFASSKTVKKNITDLEIDTSKIYQLKPYSYNYINDPEGTPKTFGLMAEDTAQLIPELTAYDSEGNPHHVNLESLSVLLLNEMKKQKVELDTISQKVEAQQNEIDALKNEIEQLKTR